MTREPARRMIPAGRRDLARRLSRDPDLIESLRHYPADVLMVRLGSSSSARSVWDAIDVMLGRRSRRRPAA